MAVLKELMETGKLTPVIDRTYSLGEVPEAIRYPAEDKAEGKVVITVYRVRRAETDELAPSASAQSGTRCRSTGSGRGDMGAMSRDAAAASERPINYGDRP